MNTENVAHNAAGSKGAGNDTVKALARRQVPAQPYADRPALEAALALLTECSMDSNHARKLLGLLRDAADDIAVGDQKAVYEFVEQVHAVLAGAEHFLAQVVESATNGETRLRELESRERGH